MPKESEAIKWLKANLPSYINHNTSSEETKKFFDKMEGKWDELEKRMDKEKEVIGTRFTAVDKDKVSWRHFMWIVGLLTLFMTAILGAIWVQTINNGAMMQNTRSEVSYMKGILDNSENE